MNMIGGVKGLVVRRLRLRLRLTLAGVLMTALGCGSSGGSSKDAATDAPASSHDSGATAGSRRRGARQAATPQADGASGTGGADGSATAGAPGSDAFGRRSRSDDAAPDAASRRRPDARDDADLGHGSCARRSVSAREHVRHDTPRRPDVRRVVHETHQRVPYSPSSRADLIDAAAACVAQGRATAPRSRTTARSRTAWSRQRPA